MEKTSSGTKPAVALLIDGENANPSVLEAMWKKVGEAGDLRVKCLIGNFRLPMLGLWKDAEAKYGLNPIQATAHVAGKNTSDSRLIIEAMRLYYETDIRTFVIMSSDSDFTQLALFLREKGARVIGIGAETSAVAWRSATEFLNVTPFLNAAKATAAVPVGTKSAPKAQPAKAGKVPGRTTLTQVKTLHRWISALCHDHRGAKGWTQIAKLETLLAERFKIDYRKNWEAENLLAFLRAHPERYVTSRNLLVKVSPD